MTWIKLIVFFSSMNNNKFIDLNLYSSVINLIANRTTTAKILEDLIKAYIYIYIYTLMQLPQHGDWQRQ